MLTSALKLFGQDTPQSDVVEPSVEETLPVTEAQSSDGISTGIMILLIVLVLLYIATVLFSIVHLVKNTDVPKRTLWMGLVLIPFVGLIYILGPMRSYNKGAKPAAGPAPAASNPVASQPQTGAAPVAGATGVSGQTSPPPSPAQPVSDVNPVQPTPITPPTTEQPQVAAAPENPVQVPSAPPQAEAPSNDAPSEPIAVQPAPPSEEQATGATSEDPQPSQDNDPNNPVGQA